jgi:hypothetical protein
LHALAPELRLLHALAKRRESGALEQLRRRESGALKKAAQLRAGTPTLRFPCVFFLNEALNAVLHLRELSDQLDVTLESSKRVKLALTWVATTQSDAIK